MKLTILLFLPAMVLSTAISNGLLARDKDTRASPAESPELPVLADPLFNDTETAELDIRDGYPQKRAYHNVYFCVDAYWGGYCANRGGNAGACLTLGNDLNDKVSSVGPDAGGYCRFYFDAGCVDNNGCRHFDSTSPGRDNLALSSQRVCGVNSPNDQITSWQCWDQ